MPPVNADRHVDLAHAERFPVPHVPQISLDEVTTGITSSGETGGIVENTPISGIDGIPGRIVWPLWLRAVPVVYLAARPSELPQHRALGSNSTLWKVFGELPVGARSIQIEKQECSTPNRPSLQTHSGIW